ncbi:MAG: serine/threonine-protein kinase RsbW [Chloroflexota bacterium]|jgi:serine/threonine-protein kinase RsbW|nr:serine/threonine-protein kinase RsbW [Chloroflexota bacterium]
MRISSDVGRLAAVREMVRSAAIAAGGSETFVSDLVQAVDETATNVIVHGHAGNPGWLEVGVSLDDDRLIVTVEDDAPGFDPTMVPEPDLTIAPDHRRPGGMGVHLARLSVDEMTHRARPEGGNILTLIRRLDSRGKEDR